MPTFDDARQATEVLRNFIADALTTDYAATFAKWRGADVILSDSEKPSQRVGKPYIVLEPAGSEDYSSEWGRGAWRVRVNATVVAGGNSGAIKGAANPTGSDTLLSRALKAIIRDGYADLRDAGLLNSQVTDPRETNTDDTNGVQHSNAHEVTFIYFDEF
jgi:hypothetical protein